MEMVLEYSGEGRNAGGRALSPFMIQVFLAYAHANLCWQVSQLTLVSVCSHFRADFVAWTPLAWLPGSVATYYFGKGAGITLMFLVSVVAGQMLRGVLMRLAEGGGWRGEGVAARLADVGDGGAVAGVGAGAGGVCVCLSVCGVGDDARVRGRVGNWSLQGGVIRGCGLLPAGRSIG